MVKVTKVTATTAQTMMNVQQESTIVLKTPSVSIHLVTINANAKLASKEMANYALIIMSVIICRRAFKDRP